MKKLLILTALLTLAACKEQTNEAIAPNRGYAIVLFYIFALRKLFTLKYLQSVGQQWLRPADNLPCFFLTRLIKAVMPETFNVPWSRPCRGITGDQRNLTAWKDTHFFLLKFYRNRFRRSVFLNVA